MCLRKDKDVLEDKWRSSNSEREHEQIERVVQESGGKLTRRLANSQVRALLPSTHWPVSLRTGAFWFLMYF